MSQHDFDLGHVGTSQGHVGTSGVMLGQVRVMLGQVGSCWDKWVMLGQVGSCWDRSESCLCVTTFWPVPYCDFDHVRVMLSTCFALFLIVIWCVTTFYLVPYCDFDHVPT